MIYYLLALTFIISFTGTFIVKKVATRKRIMDIPNVRSSHDHPVARGGGLAIVFAWYGSITLLFVFKEIPQDLFFAMLCGIPISVIGFIDDIISVSSKLRLVIQVVFASLAVVLLGGITSVDLGFTVLHSLFLFSTIGIIGIVWFINLFNFLDGIDGYISTEIIFISLSVFLFFGFELPLLLAAATAGFLFWNWQPAKIFMGDVGSTLLGFTVGVFAVYYQSTGQSSIIIWLMLTSLFWFDATLTLYRRWRNKEPLSKAHKKHAYQRIVQSGFSHQKTVLYSLIINLSILGLTWLAISFPVLLLPLFVVNIAYLYFVMYLVDRRLPFHSNVKNVQE